MGQGLQEQVGGLAEKPLLMICIEDNLKTEEPLSLSEALKALACNYMLLSHPSWECSISASCAIIDQQLDTPLQCQCWTRMRYLLGSRLLCSGNASTADPSISIG